MRVDSCCLVTNSTAAFMDCLKPLELVPDSCSKKIGFMGLQNNIFISLFLVHQQGPDHQKQEKLKIFPLSEMPCGNERKHARTSEFS